MPQACYYLTTLVTTNIEVFYKFSVKNTCGHKIELIESQFKKNTLWPDHTKVIRPPPDLVGGHLEYEVEGILKCKKPK